MKLLLITLASGIAGTRAELIGGCPWESGSDLNMLLTSNGITVNPDECSPSILMNDDVQSITAECQLYMCNAFPSDATQCDDTIFSDSMRIYSDGERLRVDAANIKLLVKISTETWTECHDENCRTIVLGEGQTLPTQSDLRASCAAACSTAVEVRGTGCLDNFFDDSCSVTAVISGSGFDMDNLYGQPEGGVCSVLWPEMYPPPTPPTPYTPRGQQYLIRSSLTNECMNQEYTDDCDETNTEQWYEVRQVTEHPPKFVLINYESGKAFAVDPHYGQTDCRPNLYQREPYDDAAPDMYQLWTITTGTSEGNILSHTVYFEDYAETVYLTDTNADSQISTCPGTSDTVGGEWFFTPVFDAGTGTCFDGASTVTVRSSTLRTVSVKPLKEVKVGDMVQTRGAPAVQWSEITRLPHSKSKAPFIDIVMEGPEHHALAATEHHTFPSCTSHYHHHFSSKMVPAHQLKPGDCLRTADGERTVASVARRLAQEGDETYTVELKGGNDMLLVGGVLTHAKPQKKKSAALVTTIEAAANAKSTLNKLRALAKKNA